MAQIKWFNDLILNAASLNAMSPSIRKNSQPSLIHLRKKQAAASTVLMMSKEGKALVTGQVFPPGAHIETLAVDKTQSLLHLNFNVNVVPLGQKRAKER